MDDIQRDDLISDIEEKINKYSNLANRHNLEKEEYHSVFIQQKELWGQYKEVVKKYRLDKSFKNKEDLLQKSEEVWNVSNNVVYEAQLISELKNRYYSYLIISALVSLLLIILVIVSVKQYVRDKLEVMAIRDSLTQTYNRTYLDEYIRYEIERAERTSMRFSMIMLDIDHFKKINDIYGHGMGDYALQKLVQVIRSNIRKYDVLARFGGEEFIILLPDTEGQMAEEIAERLRSYVERTHLEDMKSITISLGVTSFLKGDNKDSILKRVDTALYRAKNNGRNRTEFL